MKTQDTYRKHPRSRAFEQVRGEIVRRVLDVIGKRAWTASHIREATGLDVTKADLWRWREGDLTCLSDNRLLLLGEALGLRIAVTVH